MDDEPDAPSVIGADVFPPMPDAATVDDAEPDELETSTELIDPVTGTPMRAQQTQYGNLYITG